MRRAVLVSAAVMSLASVAVGVQSAWAGSRVGTASSAAFGPQRVDIFDVPHSGLEPAVVAIHGGGWFYGGKMQTDPYCAAWAQDDGVVAFSPNYSLAAYPAGVNDLRVFLGWLRANASSYGVDPNRILLVGVSAGGNLAGLLYNEPGVTAVVTWSGPMNIPLFASDPSRDPVFTANLASYVSGGTAVDASPISMVDPTSPPTLLINGSNEKIPRAQADSMAAALTADGVANQEVVLSTALHGDAYAYLTVPGTGLTVAQYTIDWLLAQS